jgi:hypothetical protein
MTATTTDAPASFDIGRVVQRTFGTLAAKWEIYFMLALIFVAAPNLLTGWIQTQVAAASAAQQPVAAAGLGLLSLVLLLASGVLVLIGHASMIKAAVAQFKGESMSLRDSVTAGAPHWWGLFRVAILSSLGAGLAAILLLVPGLMLAIRWSVAFPAQVIEDTGARASLGRSAVLTKGRRWSIFGLMLVYILAVIILEFGLFALVGGPVSLFNAMQSPMSRMVILPLLNLFIAPIGAVGAAAMYYELGGGGGSETVAEVFS